MHPFLGTLPWLHVRVLSAHVAMVAAVIVGLRVLGRLGAHDGVDARAARRAGALIVVAALAGARLHFLATQAAQAGGAGAAGGVLAGGRHAVGAIVAMLVAMPLACRLFGLPVRRFADCGAVAVATGLAVWRVGCFLHGCCAGARCDWPWCVGFPASAPVYNLQAPLGLLPPGATRSLPVHPLQLYFASAALGSAALGRWILGHRRYEGQVLLLCLLLFGATSAALEPLRYDYPGRAAWGGQPALLWAGAAVTGFALAALALVEGVGAWPFARPIVSRGATTRRVLRTTDHH